MARRKLKEHHIQVEWCKGCGICVAFCPKSVLEMDENDKAKALRPPSYVLHAACAPCDVRIWRFRWIQKRADPPLTAA
jgi:2-oxoglutarate ferredoxin oxidoreductase subunit delta